MIDAIITADSSANMAADISLVSSVPLKIITEHKEYIDNADLDTAAMVSDLLTYTGKSSTACPSPHDWLDAFDDKSYVFCVTISSNLSGSYNAANIAKEDFERTHPGRQVLVIDSLSTGGEMQLIVEKLQALMAEGYSFQEIAQRIQEYQKSSAILFMLESMRNLANNGRVNKVAAKAAGILGIRVIGKGSDTGTLQMLEKCRGEKKALTYLFQNMRQTGYAGGKVRISHCLNPVAAESLRERILALYPQADVQIRPTGGLCSFYAEKGGLIIGYETQE